MAKDWYVRVMGQVLGPLSDMTLYEMAVKRQITPDDFVRKGSATTWIPAVKVRGLFQQAASQSSAAVAQSAASASPNVGSINAPSNPASSPPEFIEVTESKSSRSQSRRKGWIIAASVGFLFLAGLINAGLDSQPASAPESDRMDAERIVPVNFDMQGMRIGDALTQEFARRNAYAQYKGGPDGEFHDDFEIGQKRVNVWYRFKDYKLISVTLTYNSELFEEIVKAYTAKFGVSPHEVTEEQLTTRIGVDYTNYIVTWQTDSGPFVVRRFGSKIDRGFAILFSPAYVELMTKEREEKEQQLQGKL